MIRTMSKSLLPMLLPAVLIGLTACAEQDHSGPRAITAERTWIPIGKTRHAGRETAARFGYGPRKSEPAEAHAGTLKWTTPEGWAELESSSMRQANFLVAGDESAQCYLTMLAGEGGGILANVNRWRGQMGLEPTDDAALAGALRAPFLGTDALVVDFSGTWAGMSGTENGADYRLVGTLTIEGGRAFFLKMVGPSELIGTEKRAFLALAASFHEDHSEHNHGAVPASADPGGDPHAGVTMDNGLPQGPSGGLSWTTPEGWRQAAPRSMRDVTFKLGPDDQTECYVSQLGGGAGGAFANINRWRGQMGQSNLSQQEFDALETLPMLGGTGTLVEVRGSFSGMGGEQVSEAALLGTVCPLPGRVVFVKLIGPHAVVTAAREDFIAFCKSLKQGH